MILGSHDHPSVSLAPPRLYVNDLKTVLARPAADDRGRSIALANATLLARHHLHGDDERRLVGDLLTAH